MPEFLSDAVGRTMPPDNSFRIGKVTQVDVNEGSVSVMISNKVIPGLKHVAAYAPRVGDVVQVTRQGAAWLVTGRIGATAPYSFVEYPIVWSSFSDPQPNINNGSLLGYWREISRGMVVMEARLVGGTTTAWGTSVWFFSLPVPASARGAVMSGGTAFFLNAGVQDYGGSIKLEDAARARPYVAGGTPGSASSTFPFTWGVTDELRMQVIYEAA